MPETLGFFGVIPSTPIAYARSIVDRGYYEDTAVDNVRLVSEPRASRSRRRGL